MSKRKRDLYEVLGIPRNADQNAIKKAYRKKVLKYRPDINKDKETLSLFREADEAYKVLKDEKKRKMYDQFGHQGVNQQASSSAYQSNVDINEFFNNVGSMFEDDFFFKQGGGKQKRSNKKGAGASIVIKLKISLKDGYEGGKKNIRYTHYVSCESCEGNGSQGGVSLKRCNKCDGSGQKKNMQGHSFFQFISVSVCSKCEGKGQEIEKICQSCLGEGRKKKEEPLAIPLRAGITGGMKFSIAGRGHATVRGGGISGDLILHVEEEKMDSYHRENNDLHRLSYINIPDAICGGYVKIKVFSKLYRVEVPKGCQSGHVVKISQKGFPSYDRTTSRGDLYIHFYVWMPKDISIEDRKLFQNMQSFKKDGKNMVEKANFFDKFKKWFS